MTSASVPPQIGKYRIVSVLGEGAMGVVYRAHDPSIDREVAIKTIRKQMLADEATATMMMDRFRREAVAAGRLSHPGIVAVYDYGDADDAAFIVMELAPGVSLSEHVEQRGWLTLPEVGGLMTQVLEALGYAHSRGVVHRDIKPANLLVSPFGYVKISDFGIARIESSSLTHTGVMLGTPAYMAPEQFIGSAIDHRVDLFACGVMLYELLTGARPFDGETIQALAYQVVHTPHVPPTQRNPSLPPQLDAILATALAKNPDARYSSAAELARGLAMGLGSMRAPGMSSTDLASEGARQPAPPAQAPPPTMQPASVPSALLSTEVMRKLEGVLAGVLGPLAGGMVRRCAARATDVNAFVEALCLNAPTPEDRARIEQVTRATLAQEARASRISSPDASVASGMRPSLPSVPSAGTPSSQPSNPGLVPPEDVARVTAELAKNVGPIARVLVKKALPRATDLRSLCLLVANEIEQEPARARFLKTMKVS